LSGQIESVFYNQSTPFILARIHGINTEYTYLLFVCGLDGLVSWVVGGGPTCAGDSIGSPERPHCAAVCVRCGYGCVLRVGEPAGGALPFV
jgi:hypothetical protein